MKSAIVSALRALAACAIALIAAAIVFAQQDPYKTQQPKDQPQQKGPQVSDGERKAAEKVQAAPDMLTKLKAASEFVKKYAKSPVRAQVLGYLGNEVLKVQDTAQQITHLEAIAVLFDQPAEAESIYPPLIDAYVKVQRYDEAFTTSAKLLEKTPGDVTAMTQMALIGTEQLKRQNPKYVQQSQQYAVKAIALIEEDKKPANMDADRWSEYKTRWLPGLYQSLGIMAFLTQDKASAREHFEKSASLNSPDPVTYMLLGGMVEEEYQELAKKYQGLSGGPLKEETLKQVVAKMDQMIDHFAHAVSLAEGQDLYKQLHDQILRSLEEYYKYRHKGSTDGLKELIDKHKKP